MIFVPFLLFTAAQTSSLSQNASSGRLKTESKGFPVYKTGRDLRKEASLANGDITLGYRIDEFRPKAPPATDENPYDSSQLQALAAASDLIAVCTIQSKVAALTDDGGFVFTHYEVSADNILLDRKPRMLKDGSFYLAAPGGTLALGGHVIHASVSIIPQLTVGQTYLLFLHLDEDTGAFQFLRPSVIAFRVDGASLTSLNDDVLLPARVLLDREANYLDAIRTNIETLSRKGIR